MKRNTLLFVFVLGFSSMIFGQNPVIELTFTAENNGLYLPLDSIFIENITQSGDTILFAPDTVLILDYITNVGGKETIDKNTFSVSQNYPNPFEGKTSLKLYITGKENIKITVRDIIGRELAQYKNMLAQGYHSFIFYSGNEKYYLLTVTGNKTSQTIKMLNKNRNTTYSEKCKIVYNEYENDAGELKSNQATNNFVFNLGDELRFTGYSITIDGILGNNVIVDTPQTTTDYEFSIIKGLRCPGVPTVSDIDGNEYNTVLIGNQCWMKENLNTTIYQNGTLIPNVTVDSIWGNLTTGAYIWYDNDISWKDKYGALYNWFATVDPNGLCPSGWHVPTNFDWIEATSFIGGSISPYGNKLKSCRQVNSLLGEGCSIDVHPRWSENNIHNGTDDYGFSGFPGGYRNNSNGSFYYIGYIGGWWASTEYTSAEAWGRALHFVNGKVGVGINKKERGFSVRCIRN